MRSIKTIYAKCVEPVTRHMAVARKQAQKHIWLDLMRFYLLAQAHLDEKQSKKHSIPIRISISLDMHRMLYHIGGVLLMLITLIYFHSFRTEMVIVSGIR